MFENYDELNEMQIDMLREIGNIGAGNAATALATILDEKVDMSVPSVRITGFDEAVANLGGAETMTVAVLINFSGDANGMIMFLLNVEDAQSIMTILVGEDDEDGLSEMKISGIKEIGNILSSSYVNAISALTGLKIEVSIPYVAIDMVGALMSVPIIEFGAIGDKLMFIEENFLGETNDLKSNMIMFAEINTLKTIMQKLGLEI
ncbi:chemotaxis protein CheC [Acetobacterium woodii]|uniref:Chemotaxis protein phosphatase CheC n=1 Tax=Acetobacterium woodii (strain ATCC 29683 / DSM 1030 / JCM 2381 / KCTC 1655 / WB1) TaxID=931626 RepID=H6LE25_ACEWD|nr:chemotaxis protein CheC [Acetobacterium woodii]AFA49258.1 chemotaxis protein phosphatase CheC [Acetobacterium woodii DSM 1030]